MTSQEYNTIICPKCARTDKECENETSLEKNPITYWLDANWGLSCDECWYAAHPESDKSEDGEDDCVKGSKFIYNEGDNWICDSVENDETSVNTQEECCECHLTEKQYNIKKGYESNLSTLHYIGCNTYCPDCRDPENSHDDDYQEDTS